MAYGLEYKVIQLIYLQCILKRVNYYVQLVKYNQHFNPIS